MKLNSIKSKLDSEGYFTFYASPDNSELIVGKDLGGTNSFGGTNLDAFCSVSISGNTVTIVYGYTNIQFEKSFVSESKAIYFIKEEFPL